MVVGGLLDTDKCVALNNSATYYLNFFLTRFMLYSDGGGLYIDNGGIIGGSHWVFGGNVFHVMTAKVYY